MPGMNGNELVGKLRQRNDMSEVFVVAMTGSGTATDRELALESGFDEHMTKPVDIRRLHKLFNNLTNHDNGSSRQPARFARQHRDRNDAQ